MRYFIIFYTGIGSWTKQFNGIHAFEDSEYPGIYEVTRQIEKQNNLDIVNLTNIIELSEKDYNSFRK